MLGEAVADDFDLLQFAFDFELLAFEKNETAREFLDDFAAAFVELALLAAEFIELLLSSRSISSLLPLEGRGAVPRRAGC